MGMDHISNEARVDRFPIGPSDVVGRTLAFRVLFCKSISHLRHQIFVVLYDVLHRVKGIWAPIISWMDPRNPQGILALMTIVFFLMKRYTNVKKSAELAYRRKFWKNMMRTALTYEEWAHASKMLDKETPKMNESDFYDVELVKNKVEELHHRRQEGSLRDIIFCMRADLVRNLGNMCNPELHKGRLHVPRLIKEYIDEVSTQLRMVCNSDSEELALEEKLAFMHETRHAYGRTALLLSGGASLGAFHVGVVKTLVEHKLMPRIIAGSSVGSIMCSIVATRSWPELQSFFEDNLHSLQFFDQMGGVYSVVKRVTTLGAVHEIRQLQIMLRHLTSNLTFQEAYDMTGRVLGITVCSPRKHEPPRCLNYLTSPHVVIWSAVTASCAFPGLFEAQELMAKDRSGEIVPYHPPFNLGPEEGSTPVRRWRDGSLEMDLPMMQLKELFNVNHFIVSQANPHIAPLLRLKEFVRAHGGNFAAKLAHLVEMEVKHRCHQVLELGFPLGGLAKLFAQDWEGDVTVVMPATLAQYSKIIQNPSHGELQKAANQGRRCTWEKLSAIKANCGIELVLDECVAVLNHTRRLKRSSGRAAAAASQGHHNTGKFNASKRIPSWNVIARENSTGSLLEEDFLMEVASSMHQGVGSSRGTPGKSWKSHRVVHDASDSESESVDLNSWTRSGGPLMRTSSSDMFINFVQNLEVDTDLNRVVSANTSPRDFKYHSPRLTTPDRCSENLESDQREIGNRVVMNASSIMVTEGDLLQPERILNGIVFNVVKKGDLTPPSRSHDYDSYNNEVAECFQIDCPGKEMDDDASSASENGDGDSKTARPPTARPHSNPTYHSTTDFDMKPGTNSWASTCTIVRQALEEHGCFIVVYDKASNELQNGVFCSLKDLFDLPLETKLRNIYEGKPLKGYVGQHPKIPLHESMGIDEGTTLEGIQNFAQNMWPSGNPNFCEYLFEYAKVVEELDGIVGRMIFESYGVVDEYDTYIGSTSYLLRLLAHKAPEQDEPQLGFVAHTDKSFTTILHQNHVNGLMVETKDGRWFDVDFSSPTSFVVMAGDALMAWSNDRIKSPNHKVVMNGNEKRYSFGLFAFNKGILQVPEKLIDEEHPLQYKPFDHQALLNFGYSVNIKTYCGIV